MIRQSSTEHHIAACSETIIHLVQAQQWLLSAISCKLPQLKYVHFALNVKRMSDGNLSVTNQWLAQQTRQWRNQQLFQQQVSHGHILFYYFLSFFYLFILFLFFKVCLHNRKIGYGPVNKWYGTDNFSRLDNWYFGTAQIKRSLRTKHGLHGKFWGTRLISSMSLR